MSIVRSGIRNLGLRSQIALAASVIVSLAIGSCSTVPAATITRPSGGGFEYTSSTTGTKPADNGRSSDRAYSTSTAIASAKSTATRDKFKWPFSSKSPWNMPIGSGARYKPANIQQAYFAGADEELFYKVKASDPVRSIYAPGAWGPGRCTGTSYPQGTMQIPDNLIVPDATKTSTPNNPSAFLMPDGKTLVQLNPLARCTAGGNVYGWRTRDVSIYGDGLPGGHGGSGLSSIGGSIRLGELTGSQPIRHALKINLWAQKYLYYSSSKPGYRWPAERADNYAASGYGGTNPSLVMGTLLAIPPSVTESSLGLQTPGGRKLFHALQNYGGYVVDDTAWDAHALSVEKGVLEQFRATFGYDFQGSSGAFYSDFIKLFKAVHIVDNNGANSIGGGGKPRAPLAPPIGK